MAVKIGHHNAQAQAGRGPWLYPMGTMLSSLARDHGDRPWIIIESNSILHDVVPDLCIYLDGNDLKSSAAYAKLRADMRRGEPCLPETITKIAGQLDLPVAVVKSIAWLAGARPEPFTIGILAGGESSRMGRDKAFLEFDGRIAIERLFEMLKHQSDRVMVSAKAEQAVCFPGMEVIVDTESGKGPLMGIVSVLKSAASDLTGIVACDIPAVDPNLFPLLCSRMDDNEIAVPTFDGTRPEPLLAVYRKSVLTLAERALAQGDYRVADLFKKCRTVVVDVPDADWYFNINTAGEYERFRATLDGKGKNP